MLFKITRTEEDFLEFNRYHVMNSELGSKAYKGYRLSGPVMCLFLFIVLLLLHIEYTMVTTAFLAAVAVVWFLMAGKWFVKGIDTKVRSTFKDGKMPFNEEEEIIFADEYIVCTSNGQSMSLKYADVKKVVNLDKYMYIYSDDVTAIIIPWECIGDRKEEVRKLLKEKTE